MEQQSIPCSVSVEIRLSSSSVANDGRVHEVRRDEVGLFAKVVGVDVVRVSGEGVVGVEEGLRIRNDGLNAGDKSVDVVDQDQVIVGETLTKTIARKTETFEIQMELKEVKGFNVAYFGSSPHEDNCSQLAATASAIVLG